MPSRKCCFGNVIRERTVKEKRHIKGCGFGPEGRLWRDDSDSE